MDQLIAPLVECIRQHNQIACVALPYVVQGNILSVYAYRGCTVRHTSQVLNRRLKSSRVEIDLAVKLFNVNRCKVFHATILNNHKGDCVTFPKKSLVNC